MTEPLLTVEHLTMRFDGLTAIDDLSFEAQKSRITYRSERPRPLSSTA